MSRHVPAAMLARMQSGSTAITKLIKIGPLPDDSWRPLAFLDINFTYDDGEIPGALTYIARTGAEMSAFISTSDTGVDNAEANSLPPVDSFPLEGFTREQVESGALDKVPYIVYAIDFEHPEEGHFIWCGGTLGEIRIKNSALFNLELRSLSQQLKQIIGDVDSISCRAKFGSQYAQNSNGDAVVEDQPCTYDLDLEWIDAVVTATDGDEPDRIFEASSLTQDDDYFAPGLVQWVGGDNAGQETEVDAFSSGDVALQFATNRPIQVGDTFRIRRDCRHSESGHNSCRTFFGTAWRLKYRGEPWIPVGDTGVLNTIGAGVPGSITGTGESTL